MMSEKRLNANQFSVTLGIETRESGMISASVMEFPDCHVEAATREEAISKVQAALLDRLAHIETIPWNVPLSTDPSSLNLNGSSHQTISPWVKFAGIFENDSDFAKIAAEIRAEREIEDDTEVNPSVYSLEE
jgi:predicted RNase H-like HicB family nuclease